MKKFFLYVLLTLLALAAIGPFLWLISTALKSPGENIFQYPPRLLPAHPTLENFTSVWQQVPMLNYFINSLGVAFLTVFLNLVFSILAAYPLARMTFKGRQAVFYFVLSTMMVPFQVILIPLYLLMLQLGLTDNGSSTFSLFSVPISFPAWLGLSLPFAVSGFGIFFVRQAFLGLPRDLEESAVLDGCNSFQVLSRVLVPMIKPTLATLAVFSFLSSWGEFLWPSLLLSQPEHFTLPVGLVQLQGAFSANWRLIAAGTSLSMIPIIVFFVILQRYFIAGATAGAVKG